MSPNLSETRIVWPSLVRLREVGRLGRSLAFRLKVNFEKASACARTNRWLRSFGPSSSHTLSFLSSPTVMMCSKFASTAEKRIGPDFTSSVADFSSRFVVDPSSFPVLDFSLVRHHPSGDAGGDHTPTAEQRNVDP